jgi:hypothetical protein
MLQCLHLHVVMLLLSWLILLLHMTVSRSPNLPLVLCCPVQQSIVLLLLLLLHVCNSFSLKVRDSIYDSAHLNMYAPSRNCAAVPYVAAAAAAAAAPRVQLPQPPCWGATAPTSTPTFHLWPAEARAPNSTLHTTPQTPTSALLAMTVQQHVTLSRQT